MITSSAPVSEIAFSRALFRSTLGSWLRMGSDDAVKPPFVPWSAAKVFNFSAYSSGVCATDVGAAVLTPTKMTSAPYCLAMSAVTVSARVRRSAWARSTGTMIFANISHPFQSFYFFRAGLLDRTPVTLEASGHARTFARASRRGTSMPVCDS